MPYLCETCRLVQEAKSPCPTCGGNLKFTILAAPGAEVEPLPGVPTTLTHRYGSNPHATRNYDQDVVHSPFASGLGKAAIGVFLAMGLFTLTLYFMVRNFR